MPHAAIAQGVLRPLVVVLTSVFDDRIACQHAAGGYIFEFVSRVSEAEAVLTRTGASILITRATDGRGMTLDSFVRSLVLRAPRLVVVVLASVRFGSTEALLKFHGAGAFDVILDGEDDFARRLAHALEHASLRLRLRQLAGRATEGIQPRVATLVFVALAEAYQPRGVETIVAAAGLKSVRAAERMMQTARGPTPRKLEALGRLLAASVAFESTLATTEAIAHDLMFASGSALANALQTHLGKRRPELIAVGGSQYVLGVIRSRLGT